MGLALALGSDPEPGPGTLALALALAAGALAVAHALIPVMDLALNGLPPIWLPHWLTAQPGSMLSSYHSPSLHLLLFTVTVIITP